MFVLESFNLYFGALLLYYREKKKKKSPYSQFLKHILIELRVCTCSFSEHLQRWITKESGL